VTLEPPRLLRPDDNVEGFHCGVDALDVWLKRRALPNQRHGASRTYVVTSREAVVGYYALASGALTVADAPGLIRRNMPDPVPMAILGRLAIDRTVQGRGIGVGLLRDCVQRVRAAATILGIRAILIHAISDEARRFYAAHGFIESTTQPMTLMLPLPPLEDQIP
jgi:GNAT superfamily N-acetyltransferase